MGRRWGGFPEPMPTSLPSRRRRARPAVLVTTAALVLVACAGGDDTSGAPVTAPTVTAPVAADDESTASPSTGAVESPTAALAGFQTLDGGTFDADVLLGEPTVLWFWAPWCVSCRAEGPHVVEAVATHGDDVRFVGVPGRDAVGPMEQFVADTGTGEVTHVIDPDGTLWSEFGVFGQPAYAFIDAHGEMEVVVGSLGARGLDDRIERLLAA